jgi:hypothetical protein
MTERLIVEADAEKPGRFIARLERSGETIVASSRQPLVDGARALLDRGFAKTTPLTMRHTGSKSDSFRPAPLGQWARWTYTESEKYPLKKQRWMPIPADREGQKSGSKPSPGVRPSPEAKTLLRARGPA